jgi:hypothetical protein
VQRDKEIGPCLTHRETLPMDGIRDRREGCQGDVLMPAKQRGVEVWGEWGLGEWVTLWAMMRTFHVEVDGAPQHQLQASTTASDAWRFTK